MRARWLLGVSLFLLAAFGGADYARSADETYEAEIVRTRPLIESRRTPAILRLENKSGFPVMPEQLEPVNTAPVHVFMVDPALRDYHHKRPHAMNAPGNYIFTVTPKTPCTYKVWVAVKPKDGARQIAVTDLDGAKKCSKDDVERTVNLEAQSGNYRFKLTFEPDLLAGQDTTAKILVRDQGGRYINELQPIMGAFGHMTGFHDDFETIVHAQPTGEQPESYNDRGGPTLTFNLRPEKAGYLKLFTQFRINDRDVIASFGVLVEDSQFGDVAYDMEEFNRDEPEPEPAVSQTDEYDRMLAEETRQLRAEKARQRQERQSLQDLYTAPSSPAKSDVYEDIDAKILGTKASEEETGRLVPNSPF